MHNPISNIQKVMLETLTMEPREWKTYEDFPIPYATKTELKRAMEGLKQRGLVESYNGVQYRDGKFGGSGFVIVSGKLDEIVALIERHQ